MNKVEPQESNAIKMIKEACEKKPQDDDRRSLPQRSGKNACMPAHLLSF